MIARLLTGLACLACVGACAAAAPAAKPRGEPARTEPLASTRGVALRNAGFEEGIAPGGRCAPHWSCTMHADPDAFRFTIDSAAAFEGARAFCVERVSPEPWALVTQGVQDQALRGKRMRFSAAVRVERADGEGAGPWALVHGPHGNLAHVQKLVKSTQGWERLAIEFPVGATAQLFEVGLTLEGGGRACLDDARLEVLDR